MSRITEYWKASRDRRHEGARGSKAGWNYLLHLIERIEVRENKIVIVPHAAFAAPDKFPNKNAPLVEARFSPTPVV